MTDHENLPALDRLLAESEPPFTLLGGPLRVRADGIRARRRAAAWVASAVVVVLGVLMAVNLSASPNSTTVPSGPPRDFAPDRLSSTLTDIVSAVPGAEAVSIEALDVQGTPVTGADRQRVLFWNASADLGSDRHLRIGLAHERSTSADAQRACDGELEDGLSVRCTVTTTGTSTVLDQVRTVRRSGDNFPVQLPDDVSSVPPDRLWFQHRVVVYRADGTSIAVNEFVHTPQVPRAEDGWLVADAEIASIATNEVLWFPQVAGDGES